MAELYRKSSLDKLSNPEQLDRMIKISSPLSWLALVAVALIIAATVVWSIIGTLPTTETVSGVIVSAESANAIYSEDIGVVVRFNREVGDSFVKGDGIADIQLSDGTIKTVTAEKSGKLTAISVTPGYQVWTGTELARCSFDAAGSRTAVCYVPLTMAQSFAEGMEVQVYPTSVDSQKYGHMSGEIIHVEEYASNVGSLAYVLGSGNMLAEQFAAAGPIVAVTCAIDTDSSTDSGFEWSGDSGADIKVPNGSLVSAKVIVDECAPITKLIGKLKADSEG